MNPSTISRASWDSLPPARQAALAERAKWIENARPEQITPEGDWLTWLILAGRGWGKTRTGAEDVGWYGLLNAGSRIAIVAPTTADARDTCVEGDSGLKSVIPPDCLHAWNRSLGEAILTNGTRYKCFSAEEPERLRGPQHHRAWADELAAWKYPETWDQLLFGLRLGKHPQAVVTTTPRPTQIIKGLAASPTTRITRGNTFDNAANLAPAALEQLKAKYEGTRLGRQELYAEILGDLPGALWSMASLDAYRLKDQPELKRVLVSVDPAASNNEDSDEHGIIVGGMTEDQRGIVLEDASLQGTPMDWAKRAVSLYRSYSADGIVIEVNMGGDMVAHTLRTIDPNVNIIEVRASRGKHVRAEPIAAFYEQGRCAHVGSFPELETQMTQMTIHGYEGAGSPDRADALVWLMTELFPDMVERVPDVSKFNIPAMAGGWMSR
jgi:phage terminase large subunit-like protein